LLWRNRIEGKLLQVKLDGCAQVRVGDRIVAVTQGNGPFVDTREMKLDDVIELIGGNKATALRLQLLPAGATDPSKRRVVELVRDTVPK